MKLPCGRSEVCLSCEYYLEDASDTARSVACTIVGDLINTPDQVIVSEQLVVARVAGAMVNPENKGQIRGLEILPAVVESLKEAGKQPI